MKTAAELRQLVTRIDHRSYPAYKDTKGMYQFPGYLLSIDHERKDCRISGAVISDKMAENSIGGCADPAVRTVL